MSTLGYWIPDWRLPDCTAESVLEAVCRPRSPLYLVQEKSGRPAIGFQGRVLHTSASSNGNGAHFPLLATIPPTYPEWLGDHSFRETHHVRFPYVAGAMANGIASPELVTAMAKGEMLAFLGTAGLDLARVELALDQVEQALEGQERSWGVNLIHMPNEPEMEAALVGLYLRRGVRRVCASAFMRLTPSVVRYACTGLYRDASGRIQRRNFLFAKISRPETARLFMGPPPPSLLNALVEQELLTPEEADLAGQLPLAGDITVEADSGGHTDNRPLAALFPAIAGARDEMAAKFGFDRDIRIGAAGGIGTPAAVASAFSLGAAYVLTGSVNQCCVESGVSPKARRMLALADPMDVAMAPSPDMFEMGVRVQVLKRGTLYATRAARLFELYKSHQSLEDLPAETRKQLEEQIFQAPLEQVWDETRQFFLKRSPRELERASTDARHLMALVFRWYLGRSSRWAIAGTEGRELDYQIWCGPAMGACNAWLAGSFMEDPENRSVVQLARNLMEGAAVVTRAHQLRSFGIPVPSAAFHFEPRPLR